MVNGQSIIAETGSWISSRVKEPEHDRVVLAVYNDGNVRGTIAAYCASDGWHALDTRRHVWDWYITHWMYFPKPPKEANDY